MEATKMPNFTVTVSTMPTVKEKSLAFKAAIEDQTIDAVAFFKDLDSAFKDTLTALQIGDTVAFAGRQKMNKYTGKEEIVIEKPFDSNISRDLTYEEAMALPSPDLIPVDQRYMETKKYSFPDGNFFYSDGICIWKNPQEKVKATFAFIKEYNRRVTRDSWLIPDWFTLESIQQMKADIIEDRLTQVFATY
jgi:hypothetical protein